MHEIAGRRKEGWGGAAWGLRNSPPPSQPPHPPSTTPTTTTGAHAGCRRLLAWGSEVYCSYLEGSARSASTAARTWGCMGGRRRGGQVGGVCVVECGGAGPAAHTCAASAWNSSSSCIADRAFWMLSSRRAARACPTRADTSSAGGGGGGGVLVVTIQQKNKQANTHANTHHTTATKQAPCGRWARRGTRGAEALLTRVGGVVSQHRLQLLWWQRQPALHLVQLVGLHACMHGGWVAGWRVTCTWALTSAPAPLSYQPTHTPRRCAEPGSAPGMPRQQAGCPPRPPLPPASAPAAAGGGGRGATEGRAAGLRGCAPGRRAGWGRRQRRAAARRSAAPPPARRCAGGWHARGCRCLRARVHGHGSGRFVCVCRVVVVVRVFELLRVRGSVRATLAPPLPRPSRAPPTPLTRPACTPPAHRSRPHPGAAGRSTSAAGPPLPQGAAVKTPGQPPPGQRPSWGDGRSCGGQEEWRGAGGGVRAGEPPAVGWVACKGRSAASQRCWDRARSRAPLAHTPPPPPPPPAPPLHPPSTRPLTPAAPLQRPHAHAPALPPGG